MIAQVITKTKNICKVRFHLITDMDILDELPGWRLPSEVKS